MSEVGVLEPAPAAGVQGALAKAAARGVLGLGLLVLLGSGCSDEEPDGEAPARRRRARLAHGLGILAVLAAVAACSSDPLPAPAASDAGDAGLTAAAVEEAPVGQTAKQDEAAPDEAGARRFDIDQDTTLREVFDTLSGAEQACIRGGLDGDVLGSVLDTPVLPDDPDGTGPSIFSCLAPDTAREFFLSVAMATMVAAAEEEGLSARMGKDEEACMRDLLTGVDVAALASEPESGNLQEFDLQEFDVSGLIGLSDLSLGLFSCTPDIFVASTGGLTPEQESCVRGLIVDVAAGDYRSVLASDPELDAMLESDPELAGLGPLLGLTFDLLACTQDEAYDSEPVDPSPVPGDTGAGNDDTDGAGNDDHADVPEQATLLPDGSLPGWMLLSTDLAVEILTAGDDSPMAGQSFTLSATVRNEGDGPSAATTLVYYRSTDSTVTSEDTEVGTDRIAVLDASGSSPESVPTYAPSVPGMYYYGACVEVVSGESDATNNCSDAVAVTVSEFSMQDLSWVADGITGSEQRVMDYVQALGRVDPSMSQRLAGSVWLSDGVTDDELQVVAHLSDLAIEHPDLAVLISTVPDQTSRHIGSVLGAMESILGQSERWLPLQSQPWFQDELGDADGALTEEQGALMGVLSLCGDEFFQDLVQSPHVLSETISLPLAGEVDLYVAGDREVWLEDTIESMAVALPELETLMGTPLPSARIVAHVYPNPPGSTGGGLHFPDFSIIRVGDADKSTLYHELAHYYFRPTEFPDYLSEGGADFLASYLANLFGDSQLYPSEGLGFLQSWILENCAAGGRANVQEWMDNVDAHEVCHYWVGEQFLQGMYRSLGHDVVFSALRELYGRGSATGIVQTEDEIYEAFLAHTPQSRRDEFRLWYDCLHGRPIPGYTAPPKPAASPQARSALAALYNATDGPNWNNNENWLTEAPLDQWHGVYTDCDGSVTELVLADNGLTGSVPPELSSLSSLLNLDLSQNRLSGKIPSELGSLSGLLNLDLSENRFGGQIPPELASLSGLLHLNLATNVLIGEIPPELGKLPGLVNLDLRDNRLDGEIPPEFGNLQTLDDLGLGWNQLTGPIPPELGNLSELRHLGLMGNRLSGEIPPELGNLQFLSGLWLAWNQLTGPIPPELGRLSTLIYVTIQHNQLTGSIPPGWDSLSHFRIFLLSGNQFTGCVPQGLEAVETNDVADLGLDICGDS